MWRGVRLVREEWSGSLVHEICLWLLPTGTGNSKIRRIPASTPWKCWYQCCHSNSQSYPVFCFLVIDSYEGIRYQRRALPKWINDVKMFFLMYIFKITLTYCSMVWRMVAGLCFPVCNSVWEESLCDLWLILMIISPSVAILKHKDFRFNRYRGHFQMFVDFLVK